MRVLSSGDRLDRRNSVEGRLRNRLELPPIAIEAADEIAALRGANERLLTLLAWSLDHHRARAQTTGDWTIACDWNWGLAHTILKQPNDILAFDVRKPSPRNGGAATTR